MDNCDSINEESPASSDPTKASSSASENHPQNAPSSSAAPNKNGQHAPSSEIIPNYLRLVNLAWKKYTDHMNGKIYVASKEFKRLQNLESDEEDLKELHNAIKNLKSKIPKLKSEIPKLKSEIPLTSNKDDHGGGAPSQNDLLDLAFAEVQEFMESTRKEINQARVKSKDKCSIPRQVVRTTTKMKRPRQVVANFEANNDSVEDTTASSGSTSSPSENKNNQHATSSEMITNDLRRLNSAWNKYTDHTNVQINMAGEEFKKLRRKYPVSDDTNTQNNMASNEFKKLRNLGSIEKHLDKLQKAIENLKSQVKEWQIRLTSKDRDGGALFQMIERDLLPLVSDFAEAQKLTKTEFDKLQKVIENLKSQIRLTSKEADPDSETRFKMIETDLNHLASTFAEVPKFKETYFDELQKAIEKLKSKVKELQIPLTSMEDDPDGGTRRFQMIERDLNHLASAFAEVPKFMESTKWEIDQAYAKFNKLRESNSEEKNKSESYKLRKDIVKLRVRIHSYCKIRSTTDSNRHRYEWPNINGVNGMMHFFFEEPNPGDGTMDFSKLPEPVLHCLLCFFKLPPDAFIRRTTMIYLWIGQGYILEHLQKTYPVEEEKEHIRQGYILPHMQEQYSLVEKEDLLSLEEDAGKRIFDVLITNGFIERSSMEPNSCKMSLSARSSLYNTAKDKGFTPNGTRDLDAKFVCDNRIGHSCLINVGEAIINYTPEIFEKMERIRSLYFGRWKTSAKHHIELPNTEILRGMNKLKKLTFLSLRGISLVTKLPTFISELHDLKILDLRACHNLEVIPDELSSLEKLTHLDMSECYFLENMPKSLAQLSKLEVLKGFFIGGSKNKQQSCTLSDLSQLSKLRKLNIYTSVEEFPATSDLNALQAIQGLLKLTISWGGFSSPREIGITATLASQEEGEGTLNLGLQKLDLQGFPLSSLPYWLWPSNLKGLRKLYIRGGNLCDLEQSLENQGEHWNVEILRLKYLDALEMDWSKLMRLFPKLIYLQQKECSKLNFQGYERSVWSEWKGKESSTVWMHKKAIDTRFWLQKFFRSYSISLSSLLGYDQD